MSRAMVVAAALVAVATITPHAQTAPQSRPTIVKRDRVDLSGHWEVADPAGPTVLGKEFAASQDANSLTVEMATTNYSSRQGGGSVATPGPMRRWVYQFNGVETRETFPMPDKFATADTSHLYFGYTAATPWPFPSVLYLCPVPFALCPSRKIPSAPSSHMSRTRSKSLSRP